MSNINNNEKKEIEIISGKGKNIIISPVNDYISIEEPKNKEKKNIIIPIKKEQSS